MELVITKTYSVVELADNQYYQVSSTDIIRAAMCREDVLGFNAVENGKIIGFALLRCFESDCWFLWNLLIDIRYQGKGKGTQFVRLLIEHLRDQYGAKIVTTTYIFGNVAAKRLYESLGFTETDVVCEDDVHEVNMRLDMN